MLLKLAVLGALGYGGYRYYQKNRNSLDASFRRFTRTQREEAPALAGGPLSSEARLVSRDDEAIR